MRNNHDKKTHKLGKRTIALCLALAVICTCLVPVFATEGLSSPQLEQEVSRSAEGGEDEAAGFGGDEAAGFGGDEAAGFGGDEAAGFGGDEAAGFGGDEAAGFGGDEAAGFGGDEAARPVEGDGENPGEGGPTVTDSEWGTVIEYGTDSSTETQWSGEDDVVTKPDDEVVVSGDEIKELQDMVVYRFWLKELNTLDLQDITAQAQINEMTESEYLARYGEVLWNLYFIQAVPRAETIADYSSNIQTPSSNRDPEGTLRLFDYWYTLDEFGNRVRLDLTDPISNILDDKTTTVNVYAAWKDGTVGSDKEESVDHEDLVDKNPVPVDLETKASASYEDEDGNMKSVDLPVKVKNLPSAADHLTVTTMDDTSMENFCNLYTEQGGKMDAFMGFQIAPKDAAGNVVQPNGPVTVTITGLGELGLDALPNVKVLHQKADNTIETLDASYNNGVLTFQTTSFSPFVIAYAYAEDEQKPEDKAVTVDTSSTAVSVMAGATKRIDGGGTAYDNWGNYYWQGSNHQWRIDSRSNSNVSIVFPDNEKSRAYVTGLQVGDNVATLTHTYKYGRYRYSESYTISVTETKAAIYFLSSPAGKPESNDAQYWSPTTDKSTWLADIHVNGATWQQVDGIDKNIISNVGSYIDSWPNSSTGGDSWVLERNGVNKDAFTAILDSMWDNYKTDIANKLKVDPRTLDKGDISKITLKAYKISRNNSNTDNQFFHIDCTIDVVSTSNFTAKFWVKYPGNNGIDTDYRLVDTAPYKTNSDVKNTKVVNQEDNAGNIAVPLTMTKDGVTYRLTGWYPEDSTGGAYDGTRKFKLTNGWSYRPTEAELNDGTMNFYAHYEPISTSVTITKTVTGLLGDHNGEFSFTVSFAEGTDTTNIQATKSGASTAVDNWHSFTLKDGETITFTGVPIGAVMTVTENAPGKHYTVEATGQSDGKSGEIDASFTYKIVAADAAATDTTTDAVTVANNAITITNDAKLTPDAGVILDTLPYIVILAVVVGGGVMLFLRKRRKDDED